MRRAVMYFAITTLFLFGEHGFARHPNEGSLTIEELITEALARNPELRELNQTKKAAKLLERAEKGAYFPEISVEGGPMSNRFDADKSSGTTVYGKAQWNLFRGGRDAATIRKAHLELELSEKQVLATATRIERDVARVYYEMLFLLESISLNERAVVMNSDQMKLAKSKRSSGFTSSADVIEFELRDATLSSDLKRLNLEQKEKSRELSVLLGRSEPAADLSVKGHLARGAIDMDKNAIFKKVQDANPEIVEAQIQRDISQADKAVTNSNFLPRIDVEGRYGKLADDTRLYDDNGNYTLMMRVNFPLFSGLSTLNGVGAAKARIESKETALARRKISAASETTGLFAQLESILERLDLEEKTLARSEEYYKITTGEYRRGIKNSPDMVGAAEKLIEARIRSLEYRKDFCLTKLKILGLAGLGLENLVH